MEPEMFPPAGNTFSILYDENNNGKWIRKISGK
jgi:hypothetical protein